jgi:hypothetical protein
MRIFSYICTALIIVFIINIILSFSWPAYRNTLVVARNHMFPAIKNTPIAEKKPEQDQQNIRLIESLERIDRHIELLTASKTGSSSSIFTGTIDTQTGSLLSEEVSPQKERDIPLS